MSSPGAELLWASPQAGKYPIDDYRRHVNRKFDLSLENSRELHRWSVTKPHDFWIDLYNYVGLVPALPPSIKRAYDDSIPISEVPKFFEGLLINYTENVFAGKDPNAVAVIGLREADYLNGEFVTWKDLEEKVRVARSALIRSGFKEGDRVAALVSTSVWAVVLLLASASMGAIFSSISPDMGVEVCFR
jgi:acetoacetyl-CoA synthetase